METESLVQHYQRLMNGRSGAIPVELAKPDDVDWADAPLRFTIRPGCASTPLSPDFDAAVWEGPPTPLSVATLAQILLAANGLLRRRLDVNWDWSATATLRRKPSYARGTSSGGGLYPTEIYLVNRRVDNLPMGVYQYSEAHSALVRVRMGDFKTALSAAMDDFPDDVDAFLALTTRFWKNSFKYHNFGYQLMLQDAGACVATLRAACDQLHIATTISYGFRDQALATLLGLAEGEEAPMLLLSLSSLSSRNRPKEAAKGVTGRPSEFVEIAVVHLPHMERSRHVQVPRLMLDLHRSTELSYAAPALTASHVAAAEAEISGSKSCGETVHLRGYPSLVLDLPTAARKRESCWGRFRAHPQLDIESLAQCLRFACGDGGRNIPADDSLIRFSLLAHRVKGVPRAIYHYAPRSEELSRTASWTKPAERLQELYWMPNYNVDQAAAIVLLVGSTAEAARVWKERGIRMLNVAAGLVAQRLYLASAQLSLGCGVVFGFNFQKAGEMFSLDPGREDPVLLALIGHRSESAAAYDFRASNPV